MRVLHCIPTLGGGGAERQLTYLLPAMRRAGVDLHLVYRQGGPHEQAILDAGARTYRMRSQSSYDPMAAVELAALVARVRPDVVQTWLPQMDVLGGAVALAARVPWILSERTSGAVAPDTWPGRIRTALGPRASVIVANSEGGASWWRAKAPRARVEVIGNCLPFDVIDATAPASDASLGLRDGDDVVLYAGRYIAVKNVPVLLRALDATLREHPRAVARLFGEGPDEPSLRAQLATLAHRDRVQLEGYRRDLWACMRRAAVFVSISHYEGTPNTVAEAARLGCPLVVSDIPSHRAILDDASAWFVPANDVAAVAAAMAAALDDRELAARKVAAARARTEAFSVEGVTRRYLAVYDSLRR